MPTTLPEHANVFKAQVRLHDGEGDPIMSGPVIEEAVAAWEVTPTGDDPDVEAASKKIWTEIMGQIDGRVAADDGLNASLWRTSEPSLRHWFIVAAGEPGDLATIVAAVEADSRNQPLSLPEEQAWAFVTRRLTKATEEYAAHGADNGFIRGESHYAYGEMIVSTDGKIVITRVQEES